MLAEAAGGLAAAIGGRNDLATHVDDLAGGIDAQAGARVVNDRACPSRIDEVRLDKGNEAASIECPRGPSATISVT